MIDPQAFVFYVVAGLTAACALATVVSQNIVRSATWLLFTLVGAAGVFFLLGADFVGAIQILIYVGGTMVLVVFGVMLTAQGPFISMKTSGAEWAISIVAGISLVSILCFATYSHTRPVAITETSWINGVVKITTGSNHGFAVGQQVTVSGMVPAGYNGTFIINAVTATSFDYALVADPGAATSFGSAVEHAQAQESPKDSHQSVTIGQVLMGAPFGPRTTPRIDPNIPESAEWDGRGAHYLLPFEIVSIHLLVVLIGAAYLARAKRRRGATA